MAAAYDSQSYSPFLPQMGGLTPYDQTGQPVDPSKVPPVPGQGLPPGAQTGVAPVTQSPFSGAPTGGVTGMAGGGMSGAGAGAPAPLANSTRPGLPKVGGIGNDPNASAFLTRLMGRADQDINVGSSDPIIKAQTDAYAAQQERAKRSALSQAAEAGGSHANLDASARAMAENAGQNTANFSAGLMSSERNARRADIQQALSLGGSFLTQEQQMALQEELSQLDLQERAYEFDTNQAYLESPFAPGAGA